MLLTKVESSNVYAIGWNGGDILVQYKNGATYRYHNQKDNIDLFESFASCESKGQFVNKVLKNVDEFECQRLSDSEHFVYFNGVRG